MQNRTLSAMYDDYDISNLPRGKKQDSLGALYENYYTFILTDKNRFASFNFQTETNEPEQIFFNDVMRFHNIKNVKSVTQIGVPKTDLGGLPKTDSAILINRRKLVKATIKQTSARAVSVSEFPDTAIVESLQIKKKEVIRLLHKHESDASAKNFSLEEKMFLKEGLSNIKANMVRWALTGSAHKESKDIRVADFSCCFKLDKNDNLKKYSLFTTEDYVKIITSRSAGFGTGLSWTYATGTKGKKIQFKAPVL